MHPRGAGAEVRVAYERANPTATAVIEDLAWRPVARSGVLTVLTLFLAGLTKFCD